MPCTAAINCMLNTVQLHPYVVVVFVVVVTTSARQRYLWRHITFIIVIMDVVLSHDVRSTFDDHMLGVDNNFAAGSRRPSSTVADAVFQLSDGGTSCPGAQTTRQYPPIRSDTVQSSTSIGAGTARFRQATAGGAGGGLPEKDTGLLASRSLFIFSEENFIRKYAKVIIEWGYPFKLEIAKCCLVCRHEQYTD